jgi:formate hydrogenlyase subunit 4
METYISLAMAILAAPLFPGIILKVKAFFAGKQGPPLFIKYYILAKLLRKGSVYSTSSTFVFKLGPIVSFASALIALFFFPLAGTTPLISFHGDVIVIFYLMGIGRYFTVVAALDTASPFEGMGAAREVFFSCLAEITIFTVLILFYRLTGSLSFGEYFTGENTLSLLGASGSLLFFVVVSMFMVLLTENSRVPVDDPATHLELTMIHEVMILDHSGPDLALIELGSFYKLFFYSAFITHLMYPISSLSGITGGVTFYVVMAVVYVAIGCTESIMARLKMNFVPKFILTSFALVFFAAILTMGVLQ